MDLFSTCHNNVNHAFAMIVEVSADVSKCNLQWKDNWEYLQVTGDYQRILYLSLEGLLELIGNFLRH